MYAVHILLVWVWQNEKKQWEFTSLVVRQVKTKDTSSQTHTFPESNAHEASQKKKGESM